MHHFNTKRLLYYNKIIISIEQIKIMGIFVFEIKNNKNKHPIHPAARKLSCGRIYFIINFRQMKIHVLAAKNETNPLRTIIFMIFFDIKIQ